MTRRLAGLLGAVALAALPASPTARAQGEPSFLDAYKAGIDAVEAEDWPRAEGLMHTAIAGRAEEADRLIRHFHLKPYLPHFYLGLALAEQGRCDEALASFAESARQGVVTGFGDEIAILRAREASCRERVAAEAAARERRQGVADLVAKAEASAASIAELASDPALAPSWDRGEPSLAARLEEARETIARARERLEGGDAPDDAALAAATDLARGALGQLEAVRRESELRRSAVAQDVEKVAARLGALAGTGRELLGSTRELARTAPALARRRNALAEAVDRAAGAGADRSLGELQGLAQGLERRIAELRAAAAPPPDALLAAASAWLRGEPDGVLEALAGAEGPDDAPSFGDPRAQAHALLLRAAAAYSLHEAGGDPDDRLLEAARRDAAACRRLDPDLAPLPSAFSPRFRAFFASIEPAATAP
jgi:hypothetical protein